MKEKHELPITVYEGGIRLTIKIGRLRLLDINFRGTTKPMLSDDQILLETPKHPQLDPILLIAEFDRMDGEIRITHRSSLATHRRPTDERVRIGEKINQHPLLRRKLRYTP